MSSLQRSHIAQNCIIQFDGNHFFVYLFACLLLFFIYFKHLDKYILLTGFYVLVGWLSKSSRTAWIHVIINVRTRDWQLLWNVHSLSKIVLYSTISHLNWHFNILGCMIQYCLSFKTPTYGQMLGAVAAAVKVTMPIRLGLLSLEVPDRCRPFSLFYSI